MAVFPMKLLGDLIAVRPDSTKPEKGKIVMPDWSRCLRGKVLAAGSDCKELAVDDHVAFRATSGMESVFDGAAIRIMREDDVDFVLGDV